MKAAHWWAACVIPSQRLWRTCDPRACSRAQAEAIVCHKNNKRCPMGERGPTSIVNMGRNTHRNTLILPQAKSMTFISIWNMWIGSREKMFPGKPIIRTRSEFPRPCMRRSTGTQRVALAQPGTRATATSVTTRQTVGCHPRLSKSHAGRSAVADNGITTALLPQNHGHAFDRRWVSG